jgi:hypothetical protein
MKRLGNQKPHEILSLEQTLWTVIFGISKGEHLAVAGFFKLHDAWVKENWEAKLTDSRHFFARGQ